VQRLHDFLREKDPIVARKAVKSIRQNVLILAGQPEIGRPLDDMPIEFREWLIDFGQSGYVALYRYDGFETIILAVRHQKEVGYS
jgi:plasmid stabilization system protein ParE|tara:strand:- start:2830 stop:3084 length:255 start_codon:yes stop_codon:yes gene_type:complete